MFFSFSFSRKQDSNKYNEINIETKTSILAENPEETKNVKPVLVNKSIVDTVSQSLQIESVVESDSKVKSKLPNNLQKLSAGNPANVINHQLVSEQYISIFNRYQVFYAIIIFNHCVNTNNYFLIIIDVEQVRRTIY